MKLPQLRMQSQMAKINMQTIPAKQEIEQPQADMAIKQPKADMKITTDPGKLTIDQSQAWAELGLKSTAQIVREFSQAGQQAIMEGMARRASEGTQLMEIENGGDPIVALAIKNSYDEMKQLGIKFIPSAGSVKINYKPSNVKIDVQRNKPDINVNIQKPIHQYTPGEIEIGMKQYQSLEIDFTSRQ